MPSSIVPTTQDGHTERRNDLMQNTVGRKPIVMERDPAPVRVDRGEEFVSISSPRNTTPWEDRVGTRRNLGEDVAVKAGKTAAAGIGLSILDPDSLIAGEYPVSPTANLTFNKFKPITKKELPDSQKDITEITKVAYYHGLISREALTRGTVASKEMAQARQSTSVKTNDRADKFRSMVIALSNLIRDKVLTESQARDFMMRHWHTGSFIARSLDKNEQGERVIDSKQADQYYNRLMGIETREQGFQEYDQILEDLDIEHEPFVVADASSNPS